ERMRRWYEKFAETDRGRKHVSSSDNYIDEVYAFFMNCYQLKDWIKHDTAIPPDVQKAVEGFIDKNECLRLCADICNALKHLTLRKLRSTESPQFGRRQFAMDLAENIVSVKLEINTCSGVI